MNRAMALLLIAAGLFLGGYFLGKSDEREDQLAKKSQVLETVIVTHNATAAVGQTVERKAVQRAATTAAVFNGINQGVLDYAQDHVADSSCRLDDDGVRLWTAANAGADALSAAEHDATLRTVAAAAKRGDDGPARQSPGRGPGISPVPGSAPGADRLAGGD